MSIRKGGFMLLKDREDKKQKVTEVARIGEIGSLIHGWWEYQIVSPI